MFEDRHEAGRQLATMLHHLKGRNVLVLALPRGGVEVGYEIAEALDAELDVLIVRKLGAPFNPELAIGAIAGGGARYVDEHLLRMLGITQQELARIEQTELAELRRRQTVYRGDLPAPAIAGRTVVIVDDGLATGATARAAVRAVRQAAPAAIVLAVPVAPPDTVESLAAEADDVVCPMMPWPFAAISQWYQRFEQTSDDEVRRLLELRRQHRATQRAA